MASSIPKPEFHFWIDAPTGKAFGSPGIGILGWCFEKSGLKITHIRARVGNIITEAKYGILRNDVKRAHPESDQAIHSGFSIPVRLTSDHNEVYLEAKGEAFDWITFKVIQFDTTYLKLFLFSFRMVRFWIHAFFGHISGWIHLNPEEYEYVTLKLQDKHKDYALNFDDHFRYWIDAPTKTSSPSAAIGLRGWCYDLTGREITGIRARVNFRTIPGSCNILRTDVLDAYKEPISSAHSGFCFSFKLPPGKHNVFLEIKGEGFDWTVFHITTVNVSVLNYLLLPFQIARFKIYLYLGHAGAWETLTPEIQCYLESHFDVSKRFYPLNYKPYLRCWIDEPFDQATTSPITEVRGWCYHLEGKTLTDVRVRVGLRTIYGQVGITRPDVLKEYKEPQSCLKSGFMLLLTLPLGLNHLYIEARGDGFDWTLFRILKLKVRTTDSLMYSIRNAWFKLYYKLGHYGSWDILYPHEQDYMCVKLGVNKDQLPYRYSTRFRSWIDEPRTMKVKSAGLSIRGWCYQMEGREITHIRARTGFRTINAKVGIEREDVLSLFKEPPSTRQSGFYFNVIIFPGLTHLYLEAKGSDYDWVAFRNIEINSSIINFLLFPLRYSIFHLLVKTAHPKAWIFLNSAEKEYVYSKLEHEEGEHPLRLSSHYAPIPVVPEVFPKSKLAINSLPKITVVTPSYHQVAFLEATMQSVLNNEGVHVDYIVQDGGSKDGSAELIKAYLPRLKRGVSEKDKGQADAIVNGFSYTECGDNDIMAYLNSDDLFMPGALRFVAEYFAEHPEVDAIYGHRVIIDERGLEVGRWFTPRPSCDDLNLQDLIPQETLFWRKRIWDKVGGIDPTFHFALDWDLILRFRDAKAHFKRIPYFLGQFRIHSSQKSQAQMDERGVPEMNRLRERSLGRVPKREEMVESMRRAQIESILLRRWYKSGVRK